MNAKMQTSARRRWKDPAERQRASLRGRLDQMRPVLVYGLIGPGDDEIRYVGCSHDPAARLKYHLSPRAMPAVREWVDSLDGPPEIVVLGEANDRRAGELLERKWIRQLFFAGHRLTNSVHNPFALDPAISPEALERTRTLAEQTACRLEEYLSRSVQQKVTTRSGGSSS